MNFCFEGEREMTTNWIQHQYRLQTQLPIPQNDDTEPQTGIIVGYTFNARGRADGVNVRGRDGQVQRIDWMALSIMKLERGA